MTKYRNGKKRRPGLYDATKKATNKEKSSEGSTDQLSESECAIGKSESDACLVQCEKCNLWLCCDCQSISPNMLKAIKQFQSLHWFCKSCEPSIPELLKPESVSLQSTDKGVEHRLQTMENHLAELTNNMKKLSSHWGEKPTVPHAAAPVAETFSSSSSQFALKIVDEYKDREHRKLNLIFHKVPESEHTEPSAKRDHDKKFVLSVAEELGVDELEVVNTTRIGHVKESGERLLKVEVKNVSSKKNILSKAKLLHQAKNETYHRIYITPDQDTQ